MGINKSIHLEAFGESGKILFQLHFEPYFNEERFYQIVENLCGNTELATLFGERITEVSIMEEKAKDPVDRGFYEGMTVMTA